MQCLYCDRHLGLFHGDKGPFCSEKHEELYREAAQRRLEAPYGPSARALETSLPHETSEVAYVEDLAQLLKATQTDSGVSVETFAEGTIAAESLESVMVSVTNSASATSAHTIPEAAPAGSPVQVPPPDVFVRSRSEEPPLLADSKMSSPPDSADIPPTAEDLTDRRMEPRVKDVKIVKIATLRDPERETSCALVDTSASGIQFTSDIDFRIGEILVAALPNQLALAEVIHSQAKGDRYTIGAERIETRSTDGFPESSSGPERAEVLIEALCDRVRTGFVDEPGQGPDAASSDHRQRALERVARILEIWQKKNTDGSSQAGPAARTSEPSGDSARDPRADAKPSSGVGRAFAAVAAALLMVGLLTVCVIQFRKSHAVSAAPQTPSTPKVETAAVQGTALAAAGQTPVVAQQPAVAAVRKTEPAPQPAPAVAGGHRAQIRAIETTWVAVTTDGQKIFGAMLQKGSTKDLEYSKFAFVHTGNEAGIEITVDGQAVPMGKQPKLRLVELTATGSRFLRWSNDDPAQP